MCMYLFSEKNMAKIFSTIIFFIGFFFIPFFANAATLSISPAVGSLNVGGRVSVKVLVSSSGLPLNAVSSLISISPSFFSIESVSKTNSILNFWVTEPTISGSTVKFEGVALSGAGSSGTVVTINLRAIKSGEGLITFKSGQILANDGQGTDITGTLSGAKFSIGEAIPKIVTPEPVVEPKVETPPATEPTSTPEIETQPLPSLRPPEIVLGSKYGVDAIFGTSDYPRAQALITFMSDSGTKVFIISTADEKGSFDIVVPNSLKRGLYTVSSIMIKEDKTNSEASNTIHVNIGNVFSDIAWWVWLTFSFLICCIVYLLIRIYTFPIKYKKRV